MPSEHIQGGPPFFLHDPGLFDVACTFNIKSKRCVMINTKFEPE